MSKKLVNTGEQTFRLTGIINGQPRWYRVRSDYCTLGAKDGSHIVINQDGVSREHAVLRLRNGELVIEDRHSKNGTFLTRRIADATRLEVGDRLQLGSVELQVGLVDTDDAELAVVPSRRHDDQDVREQCSTNTREPAEPIDPARWLPVTGEIAAVLVSGRLGGRIDPLLARLAEAAGAEGACLLEWPASGEPLVLASAGQLPDADALRRVPAEAARRQQLLSWTIDADPRRMVAFAAPGPPPRGLVLSNPPRQQHSLELLMEAVLPMLLLAVAEPASPSPSDPPELPELRHAEGIVVCHSSAMTQLYHEAQQLLIHDEPVLLLGETGVGKEHIARLIHDSSDRAAGPFVAVNCTAIADNLAESELFGIERGVATGVDRRTGYFERANRGTILLDEIADMSPQLQAKLLRVLQEMEVAPVGGKAPRRLDVRVLSATNADLEARIADGSFRQDLYHRLAGTELRIPPLRRRRDDIQLMVQLLVDRAASDPLMRVQGVSVKAMQLLTEAPWPGNVRELQNVMRKLLLSCPSDQRIEASMLPDDIRFATPVPELDVPANASGLNLKQHSEELERRLIAIALDRAADNRSEAARLLGLHRNGLAGKLRRLGLDGSRAC